MKTPDRFKQLVSVWKEANTITNPSDLAIPLQIIDQIANYFSAGSFYYYIFNFTTLQMEYVHPNTELILGVKPADFTVENVVGLIHPDDFEPFTIKEQTSARFLFEFLPPDEIPNYKVSYMYRIKNKDKKYVNILHNAVAIQMTADSALERVIGIHTDITHFKKDLSNTISYIHLKGGQSYYDVQPGTKDFTRIQSNGEQLSKRELEIVNLASLGLSNTEIAVQLFISPFTAETHRKKIISKLGASSMTEAVAICIRKGLI